MSQSSCSCSSFTHLNQICTHSARQQCRNCLVVVHHLHICTKFAHILLVKNVVVVLLLFIIYTLVLNLHTLCLSRMCRSQFVDFRYIHICSRFAHILLVNNVVVVLQMIIIYTLVLDLHTFCLSTMSQSSCSCSSFTHLYQICTHSACQQCRSCLVVVHHLHICTKFAHILLVKNVVVVLLLFIIYTLVLNLHTLCLSRMCRSQFVDDRYIHICSRFANILFVNNVVVVLQLFIIYTLVLDLHTFCLSTMSQSSCSCSSFTHLYQICTYSACQQCRSRLVVVHHLHTCTRFAHILLVKNVVVVLQLFIIYSLELDLHIFCLSRMSQSSCSCSSFIPLNQICTHSACQECRSRLVVVHHLHTCTRFAHILLVKNVVVVLQLFIIYTLVLDLHTFCLSRMSQSSCSCSSFTHLYQICTYSACQECRSRLVVVHHLFP